MTLPQVYDLWDYWAENPPEHEMIAMLAQVYTSWRPNEKPMTEADQKASLEARWKHGALNVKQLYESMGGVLSTNGSTGKPSSGPELPGIGPFPGL